MEDPYQTKEDLKIGGVNLSETWRGAKRVDNWKDPFDVGAAAAAHTAEFLLPQSKEEVMMELATLGQGKKIKLGRKLVHAALKDIPFYQKGEKYVSGKLNEWFSQSRFKPKPKPAYSNQQQRPAYSNRPDADGLYTEAPIDEQSMWEAQQRKLLQQDQATVTQGFADPTGQASSKFYNPEFGDVLANADPKNVELLKKIGLDDNQSKFVLDNYYKVDRDTAAAIENLYNNADEFEDTKRVALPYLLEAWSNIKRTKTPQLDHVNQLKAALPFFNNAQVQEFPAIARILLEEGVFGGHSRKNFKYLEFDVHSVKSAFWRRRVGGNGEKFFAGKDISTPEKLRAAAREYAEIINESNDIVNNAIEQYKLMNQIDVSEAELLEIVDRLGSDRIDPKTTVKQVRAIIAEIEADDLANTSKASEKAEKAVIKQEGKDLKAADKKKEQLAKDAASVDRRTAEIEKYISTREKAFKGAYPLGMKDDQLHVHAEAIVKEMKRNRLLRENIQGTIYDQQDEAALIEKIKRNLFEKSRRK